MRCSKRDESLPIGVEAVQEVKGEERCGASCARMREEVETFLARNEAEVMQLAAAMAMLGSELVGKDTYARAGELVPLILAGERSESELVELFRCGYRRVQAVRTLQAAVRCCLGKQLGPNRESDTGAGVCAAWIGGDVGAGHRI